MSSFFADHAAIYPKVITVGWSDTNSFALCGPNWPARAAIPSCRRPHQRVRSNAAWPNQDSWHTCSSANMATTCRCIDRQAEIFAREALELGRMHPAQLVGNVTALLTPLTDALRTHVLAADVVDAQDTPLPVLAPGRGKTKTSRLWTYVRDDRPAAGESRQRSCSWVRV
jgi:hypothetical protein